MSKLTDNIVQPTVSALVILIVGFVGFYFSSFAGKMEVGMNTDSIIRVEKKLTEHTKQIDNIGNKVDRVLVGLCIINAKACSLKDRPE